LIPSTSGDSNYRPAQALGYHPVMPFPPLERSFFDRDPVRVARDLLGTRLVRTRGRSVAAGRIVEVEAYLARDDSANHAFRGRTPRNASMFGPPGHAYVYAIHGRFCLNAVTETDGVPSAVLIRAVEPLAGIAVMQRRRGTMRLADLTRGPARLCEAFAIDPTFDGWDLTLGRRLWIARDPEFEPAHIATSVRIGVTSAHDLPLRFYLPDSPHVSRRARVATGGPPVARTGTSVRTSPTGGAARLRKNRSPIGDDSNDRPS
jgi:DNA-3-methyladenine glycosylase